jgi:hypothetical protein
VMGTLSQLAAIHDGRMLRRERNASFQRTNPRRR